MTKRIPRKSALPRKRSAPALALQSPRHRQRVIPDKRRASNERELRTHIRETEHRAANEVHADSMRNYALERAGLEPFGPYDPSKTARVYTTPLDEDTLDREPRSYTREECGKFLRHDIKVVKS